MALPTAYDRKLAARNQRSQIGWPQNTSLHTATGRALPPTDVWVAHSKSACAYWLMQLRSAARAQHMCAPICGSLVSGLLLTKYPTLASELSKAHVCKTSSSFREHTLLRKP